MTIVIDERQAQEARKCAMQFHARHGIKSLAEIIPHRMEEKALRKMKNDLATEARGLLDRAGETKDDAKAASQEAAHDGFMTAFDSVLGELAIREEIGNMEPRANAVHPKLLANRPGVDAAEVRSGDHGEAEAAYAFGSEQRFTTWAQARAHGGDYRGLSVGQYLRSMVIGGKSEIERRALSEGSDSAGGYTVPDVLSAQLIDLARAQSVVMRAGAQTVPLTSDRNNIAKLLSDPVPGWRAEAGGVAESDPTFGLVSMVPRSLAVFTKVSAELMEDSLNLATELPRVLAAAMAVELDRAALLGTGTAPEPRGVANTAGIGTFAVNGPLSGYSTLSKARTGILTANEPITAYIMHPRDEGTFTDMLDGNGLSLMPPPAIGAIPKLTTTSISVDGGSGDDESTIFAGNFARLLVGIRSEIRVEVLKTSTYATNLQYTLLAHMRADVAVTHPGAFYTLTGIQG